MSRLNIDGLNIAPLTRWLYVAWSHGFTPYLLEVCVAPMSCVFEDNEGTVQLARNPKCMLNSKHVDIRLHFPRDFVFRGELIIIPVKSELKLSEFLTKPLSRETFCFHRDFLLNIGFAFSGWGQLYLFLIFGDNIFESVSEDSGVLSRPFWKKTPFSPGNGFREYLMFPV